jgi:ElaB/YqjD/DUF883 family membrane-anchored ribosome-binding protein
LALDLHAEGALRRGRILLDDENDDMSSPTEGQQGSESISEHARDLVGKVADAASECCSGWTEQYKHLAESAEEYVRKQPVKSLLIAAGVGLLVGLAVRR